MNQLQEYLPFWPRLTQLQQEVLEASVTQLNIPKGRIVHNGTEDCVGLLIVTDGQLRAYALSDEGREVTLFRLFDRDLCLFSASCILRGVDFDVTVSAETDSTVLHIPAAVYQTLMTESAPVANFTNEILATRFSDVMWLLDQILHKRMDSRMAALLIEESQLVGTDRLQLTHDQIARHLGSAREVVTRLLRYFRTENLVSLTRGGIKIEDMDRLIQLASGSLR